MALGKKDWPQANVIADMLRHDYKPFYLALKEYYQVKKPGSAEIKDMDRSLGLIQRAMILIPRVFMGQGQTTPTLKEVDELNELLETIESGYAKAIKMATDSKDQEMLEAAKYASDMTGINPEAMSLATDLQERAKKESKKGKGSSGRSGGMIDRSMIGTALHAVGLTPRQGALAYAGAQIAAPLLGPLFGVVYPMIIAATKMGSKLGGLGAKGAWGGLKAGGRVARGAARLPMRAGQAVGKGASSVLNWIANRGTSKEAAVKSYDGGRSTPYLTRKTPAVPYTEKLAVADATPMQTAMASHVGIPISRRGKAGHNELRAAAAPLFYFFDKMAHRAKWTKAVLKALKRRGTGSKGLFDEEGDDGEPSIMGSILAATGISKALKWLGSKAFWLGALKLGGVALALYALKESGEKAVENFKEWMKVSKAVQVELEKNIELQRKLREGSRQMQLEKIAESDMSPEQKRKARLSLFEQEGKALARDEVNRFEALPPWQQGWQAWKAGASGYKNKFKSWLPGALEQGRAGATFDNKFLGGGELYSDDSLLGRALNWKNGPGVGGKFDFIGSSLKRSLDEKRAQDMTLNPMDNYGPKFVDPSDLSPSPFILQSPHDLPVEGKYDKQMLEALESIEKRLGQSNESVNEPPMTGPYNSSDSLLDKINRDGADSLGN